MLLTLCRYQKAIACFFYIVFYGELLLASSQVRASGFAHSYYLPERSAISHHNEPIGLGNFRNECSASNILPDKRIQRAAKKLYTISNNQKITSGPGPTQPEMSAFSSVNANNMVDLFTGDFSYNIPLLDVGGYPVNISYKSGISMDQEASWVGLGWNVNPGTITRNMRGLPDDFDGADSIKKVTSIKENKTIGVTGGLNLEITGFPLGLGASLGVFHNNYKGWGLENSINASINAGVGAGGVLSGGLSLTNNTQEGLTIAPSISVSLTQDEEKDKAGLTSSLSASLPYNSRTGLKSLQLSAGVRQFQKTYGSITKAGDIKTGNNDASSSFSTFISFASPTTTPSITMPFTSRQYSFTAKVGGEATVVHPNFFISGYVSKQKIDPVDTLLSLPAFGYLYSQDGNRTKNPLLDFNREKEIIYRDNPPIPNIAVPFYTYDAFSITGEGTGGMFRAYRGDIGYVHDHFIRTKDGSAGASVDVGLGDMVHAGVDVNVSQSYTQNSAWLDQNSMRSIVDFRKSDTSFEASYFRNPGEKSINSKSFYDVLGGDDVVRVGLSQPGASSSDIQATNYLIRYKNDKPNGTSLLNSQNAVKKARDKRAQVISYLTASEAGTVGLSKYIENYTPNNFGIANCISDLNVRDGANGLLGLYYDNLSFAGTPVSNIDDSINFFWTGSPSNLILKSGATFPGNKFVVIWNGQIKAPVTGVYTFTTLRDDGARLWINDSLLIDKWSDHAPIEDNVTINLVAGQMYKFNLMFKEDKGYATIKLSWSYPGQAKQVIPAPFFYLPPEDIIPVNNSLKLERRITSFRKASHLSEIDVLNPDGRKYVYGIPVYNFKQKETTFSVNGKTDGNLSTGLVKYVNGVDNTTKNSKGQDNYFNSETIPAYAHSFLLTGILSSDYVDLTGNGISDDDLGDAVKFKYSKINGQTNPFCWRAPYVKDSATYNDGLKTDYRDDKGSYTYGEKELWFMHSIESKTMIATFVTENREDVLAIDESGRKYNDHSAKRLKEINLYSKADWLRDPATAKPIKTVHFDYSYELCLGVNKPVSDSGKLTLKRIWFTYNGNAKVRQNPYVFNYNSKNPSYNLKSYDRWGNYKDPLQNPGSTTSNLITNAEYPYGLQDSLLAAQNAAAWTLDSVFLPSGGSIKVNYESDDYAYVQNKRAMSMFKLAGLGSTSGNHGSNL